MTINTQNINTYIDTLFANHTWQEGEYLMIRGVGEKGTAKEGVFVEDTPIEPSCQTIEGYLGHTAARYSEHLVGTFIVPAILSDRQAKEANVKLLPAVVLDLDEIPAWQAIEWLKEEIGDPSMIVGSGGKNQWGPKLHAYYILENPLPASEVVPIAARLAEMLGADPSFMRRTQPIRVPGTLHMKAGETNAVTIESYSDDSFTTTELIAKISAANPSPWAVVKPRQSSINFSPITSQDSTALLSTTIREGGIDGITRWDAFSKVAGHYLHVMRGGSMGENEAFSATCGWVSAQMVPPWPEERIRKEWQALLDREVSARGPMPEVRKYEPIIPHGEGELGLRTWAAHRWVVEPKPVHKFLVDSFIIQGEPHLFVAEGGAGKTFLLADLAMKLAAWEEGSDLRWCGQKVIKGGTSVLVLCEDSQTEMHIRLLELDRNRLIQKAGDKLIVLPMTKLGGAFPLTERDPKTGSTRPSARWTEMLKLLRELPDLAMVAIDTLNSVSHGDENSAVVISEMMREAHRVCGELGAALVINHHLRKSSEPVKSLEDLKESIRGSTAIPSYFRINFGMFRATDYDRRCKALGIKAHKDAVWRMGVAKCNIMGLYDGEKTLVRANGCMEDRTDEDPFNNANTTERMAWLILAVERAAADGFPFATGKAGDSCYGRKTQLPDDIGRLGPKELGAVVNVALQAKQVVQCAAKGGNTAKWLDVPSGPFSRNDTGEVLSKGSWKVPDWTRWAYDEGQGKCVLKVPAQVMKINEE